MSSFISWHFVLVPTNGGVSTEENHCLSAQELEVQNLGVVGRAPSGGSDSELRDGHRGVARRAPSRLLGPGRLELMLDSHQTLVHHHPCEALLTLPPCPL